MNLIDRFTGLFSRKNSSLELFREIFGAKLAKSGVPVNWETAIKVTTILSCARVIANGIAQVPLKLYLSTEDGGKKEARDHDLYWLLHNQPNQWQTSFEYRETMALHLVLAGRHYAWKTKTRGVLRELIALPPGWVEAKRDGAAGVIRYKVTLPDSGEVLELGEDEVWSVPGLSWNGWAGMDPMHLAREAIGLAISAEEQHAKLFKNGIQSSGTYSVDGTLNKEQHALLRAHLVANNSGENAGLPMVVDRGAKWLQHAMTGVDAQHLEVRRFQVEEMCRAMGVLPIMVGHADKTATYASAEQMFIAHVVHTLLPWYQRIEQRIDAYLVGRKDVERGYYSKFVAMGLLRGSAKDRADYFSKALGSGGSPAWMTQDEVRVREELNPMGGDAAKLPIATNVAPAPKPKEEGTDE